MFNLKKLPPIERKPDGSLPRMTGRQRQDAVRLIRKRCSAHDKGNCLYLDDGEEVVCPQCISYSVCCKFFRRVLLRDEAGKELEAELFHKDDIKHCVICGETFFSTSNRAKYCNTCKADVQRKQKAEYARRRRADSRKIEFKMS